MARMGGACVCAAWLALLALSCRAPTEITVDVAADFSCADLRGTALAVGQLHDVETTPSALETAACADGATGSKVGSVVLVPSGANDDPIAFKVVAGFGRPVNECLTNFGPGCIVSRRALRYLPHTSLLVPVLLSSDCDGIACGETQTCAHGKCVSAEIDPNACAAAGGCPETTDGGSVVDASSLDAAEDATVEAAADATLDAGSDATLDATGDAAAVFHDITNPSYWTTFDTASVNAGANSFVGAAFDGRYVYFVPNGNAPFDGIVTRYDTQYMGGGGGFGASAAWATFDTSTVNAGAKGFAGAAFDGRFIYFVPWDNGVNDGIVARFDTQGAFLAAASWATFDTSTVNAAAVGFVGAAFDGRYVYLVPGSSGVVARYDTRYMGGGAFAASAAWATFDTATVDARAANFFGAAFDGRYVYFVPQSNGVVTRYDTRYMGGGAFGASAAWATFDTVTVNAAAKGFLGAAFDGRYVYFVPNENGTYDGVATRYDTQYMGGAAFGASAAWAAFDIATVNPKAKGFQGGAFDGRYVYFVPWKNGTLDGVVARYDTQSMGGGAFGASASWATFDVSSVNASARDFWGAAFDGRYVYFVPYGGSVIARFDAKTPPSTPPGYQGSFF